MLADNFKHDSFQTEPWSRLWPLLLKGWKQHERWPALNELDLVLNSSGMEAATKLVAGARLKEAFQVEVSSYTKEDIVNWLAMHEFTSIGAELLNARESKHTIQEQIDYQRERLEKLERIAAGEKSLGEVFNLTGSTDSWWTHIEDSYGAKPKPTGILRLDKKLRHGGVRPTIALIVGPTGGGKTTVLMSIGAHTVRQGGRWVQYVLDDSEGDVRERWYQHILQRPLTLEDMTVPARQAAVKKALDKKYAEEYLGQWVGINIEPDKFTPREILRDLESLQRRFIQEDLQWVKDGRGFIPPDEIGQIDGVGIDTADQIKPSRTSKDSWYEMEKMFSELSHIPKRINCPLWLTVQSGQEGVGASQITVRNVGGSYGKAKPAKLILGLAQTVAQTQNRQVVNPASEWYLDNKQHMWAYNPELDRKLEWEPAYLCIIKNTMAEGRSGLVKNVALPMLIDFSTCRMIEDYSKPENCMAADRKTIAEEKEAAGGPPAAHNQNSKRGAK